MNTHAVNSRLKPSRTALQGRFDVGRVTHAVVALGQGPGRNSQPVSVKSNKGPRRANKLCASSLAPDDIAGAVDLLCQGAAFPVVFGGQRTVPGVSRGVNLLR